MKLSTFTFIKRKKCPRPSRLQNYPAEYNSVFLEMDMTSEISSFYLHGGHISLLYVPCG